RIFANQTSADWAVLNYDDPAAVDLATRTAGQGVWFSRRRAVPRGVFVEDGWIVARVRNGSERVAAGADIGLRGAHKVANMAPATACALWARLAPAAIRHGIAAFQAVAHRIEPIRTSRGVAFYNDSKGTNVASTIKALESFTEPVILIAGGVGKG